jgi:pimeloyl-ACP methyl ester carboxylesterase
MSGVRTGQGNWRYDVERMRRLLIAGGIILLLLIALGFAWVREPDIPRATLEAKYANTSSQFVKLPDGARAHVRDRGPRDAFPLVLIHGSNASLLTWEPWVKRLSDTFRVITVDLPGHGLTGVVPNGDYSQDGMVRFMREMTGTLGLERFAMGGNSMGGRVAALFAADQPDRVTHLILVDAGGLPAKVPAPIGLVLRLVRMPVLNRVMRHITPRSIVVGALDEAVSHKDIITAEMVDSYWDFARMEGTRDATIARANIRSKAITDRMGNIKAPTLILWGEEDRVIPIDAAYEFHAAIPTSTLIVYPMTGHIPQEEVPDRSAADVRAFLTGTLTSVNQ